MKITQQSSLILEQEQCSAGQLLKTGVGVEKLLSENLSNEICPYFVECSFRVALVRSKEQEDASAF
jgi:hypothetical protein